MTPQPARGTTGASAQLAGAAKLSRIAMPVVIVGAAHDGQRSCATATVMYVSLDPPMVAVALHPGSRTTALIQASGALSVSLLGEDQVDLAVAAGTGARSGDKFAELGIPVVEAANGHPAPGVAGSLAILWCRVTASQPSGDHVLILATVEAHRDDAAAGSPLVRYQRRYGPLSAPSDPPPDNYPL
ncbi:MAG TPA: flavin reductase family protein [Candidatus Limnocylindrales bacterium]|jgi:flavin reductase (NADH)